MDLNRLILLNSPLLGGTALLGLGAIVTGGLSGPVLALGTNVTYGLIANNLGTLIDRLRSQSSDVLRNEDISKAA